LRKEEKKKKALTPGSGKFFPLTKKKEGFIAERREGEKEGSTSSRKFKERKKIVSLLGKERRGTRGA